VEVERWSDAVSWMRPIPPAARTAALALAWIALASVLSGCVDGSDGAPTATGTSTSSSSPSPGPASDCDLDAPLPLAPTWAAHGGTWGSFVQPDVAHPQGIRGEGTPGEPGLSLLVDHGVPASATVDASVRFALVSGFHPDGAGLAFHWAGDSYNLVRYSPSEGGWHLFTVIDGERTKLNATVEPDGPPSPTWCEWTELKVVAAGASVEVWQDDAAVLRTTLPDGASTSGQVGLFLRGDTVALFDQYARR
jgi:hypothetical protein